MRYALLLTAALAAGLSAQQSRPPQFRGGTDLVAIDFLAVGDDGRPVSDLKTGDVTLRVDGKPREIRSFQFVKVAALERRDHVDAGARAPAPLRLQRRRPRPAGA